MFLFCIDILLLSLYHTLQLGLTLYAPAPLSFSDCSFVYICMFGIFVFIIVIDIGGQFNERLASLVASRSVFFCQIVYVNNVSVCSYGK